MDEHRTPSSKKRKTAGADSPSASPQRSRPKKKARTTSSTTPHATNSYPSSITSPIASQAKVASSSARFLQENAVAGPSTQPKRRPSATQTPSRLSTRVSRPTPKKAAMTVGKRKRAQEVDSDDSDSDRTPPSRIFSVTPPRSSQVSPTKTSSPLKSEKTKALGKKLGKVARPAVKRRKFIPGEVINLCDTSDEERAALAKEVIELLSSDDEESVMPRRPKATSNLRGKSSSVEASSPRPIILPLPEPIPHPSPLPPSPAPPSPPSVHEHPMPPEEAAEAPGHDNDPSFLPAASPTPGPSPPSATRREISASPEIPLITNSTAPSPPPAIQQHKSYSPEIPQPPHPPPNPPPPKLTQEMLKALYIESLQQPPSTDTIHYVSGFASPAVAPKHVPHVITYSEEVIRPRQLLTTVLFERTISLLKQQHRRASGKESNAANATAADLSMDVDTTEGAQDFATKDAVASSPDKEPSAFVADAGIPADEPHAGQDVLAPSPGEGLGSGSTNERATEQSPETPLLPVEGMDAIQQVNQLPVDDTMVVDESSAQTVAPGMDHGSVDISVHGPLADLDASPDVTAMLPTLVDSAHTAIQVEPASEDRTGIQRGLDEPSAPLEEPSHPADSEATAERELVSTPLLPREEPSAPRELTSSISGLDHCASPLSHHEELGVEPPSIIVPEREVTPTSFSPMPPAVSADATVLIIPTHSHKAGSPEHSLVSAASTMLSRSSASTTPPTTPAAISHIGPRFNPAVDLPFSELSYEIFNIKAEEIDFDDGLNLEFMYPDEVDWL